MVIKRIPDKIILSNFERDKKLIVDFIKGYIKNGRVFISTYNFQIRFHKMECIDIPKKYMNYIPEKEDEVNEYIVDTLKKLALNKKCKFEV